MSMLRHGPPLAMNGYMDKEGRKLRGKKTRYFKLRDSALFNHKRKDSPATWGVSLIDSRVAVGHKGEVIVQLFDGKKILVFPHSRAEIDKWVDLLQRASTRKIGNYYGVTGLIGMGSFAEVRIGYDKTTGDQVAIKVMKKNKRDTELMRSVECEMNFISKNIDHDNIVKTYDVFDTRDNLFIVMEYMPGGMLYDILANEGQFSEKIAATIMRDLLESVQCLHVNDVVHRDIKPENVLALNKTYPHKVKLADFGLADFVLENSFGEKSTCGMYGTPFFVAPEVIRAETYTPAVDIWSLGVLVYNMLSGKLPFDGSNIKEVLRRVRSGRYNFPDSEWKGISEQAKSFIVGMLELDPQNRLTAKQALKHPWLNNSNLSTRAIQNDLSGLSYDQRKLRMSSMAIDNVAELLDMDDEDGDPTDNNTSLKALARLFPARQSSAKGIPPARRSGASSRSPSSSRGSDLKSHKTSSKPPPRAPTGGVRPHKPPAPPKEPFHEPAPARRDDVLPPLHPLVVSGSISESANSVAAEDMGPFDEAASRYDFSRITQPVGSKGHTQGMRQPSGAGRPPTGPSSGGRAGSGVSGANGGGRGRESFERQSSFGQEHDATAFPGGHVGGLAANPGVALPVIVSVKEMRRQKEAAAAARLQADNDAKAARHASGGYGGVPVRRQPQVELDDESDDDDYGDDMFSLRPPSRQGRSSVV